jgi:hypothetical protein
LRAALGEFMAQIPDIRLGDARLLWIPVAPSTALLGNDGEPEEEAPTSYAEHPPSRPNQGGRRVMRFALGIFISALIGWCGGLANMPDFVIALPVPDESAAVFPKDGL